jgi:hypothetical protein
MILMYLKVCGKMGWPQSNKDLSEQTREFKKLPAKNYLKIKNIQKLKPSFQIMSKNQG